MNSKRGEVIEAIVFTVVMAALMVIGAWIYNGVVPAYLVGM